MSSRFIHVISRVSISFLFKTEWHSTVNIPHFVPPFISDGHLGSTFLKCSGCSEGLSRHLAVTLLPSGLWGWFGASGCLGGGMPRGEEERGPLFPGKGLVWWAGRLTPSILSTKMTHSKPVLWLHLLWVTGSEIDSQWSLIREMFPHAWNRATGRGCLYSCRHYHVWIEIPGTATAIWVWTWVEVWPCRDGKSLGDTTELFWTSYQLRWYHSG